MLRRVTGVPVWYGMVCHRTWSSSQQQLQHTTGEVQCPMCTNIPYASPCNLCLATAPLRQISHIAHCSHAVSDLCASSDPSEPKAATAHCADHRETHNIPNQMQRSLAPRARVCIARSSRLHRFSAVGSSGTSQAVRQSGVAAESAVPHRTGQLLVVYCAANGACEARSLGTVAGGDRRAVPTATCRRITEREAEQRQPARAVHAARRSYGLIGALEVALAAAEAGEPLPVQMWRCALVRYALHAHVAA
jgi:hypothetical protein